MLSIMTLHFEFLIKNLLIFVEVQTPTSVKRINCPTNDQSLRSKAISLRPAQVHGRHIF